MGKIGRNDPCPCGSRKKFKNCHLGREDELLFIETEAMREEVAQNIISLPEANYGRSREIANALDIKELTGNTNIEGIRFIDFASYVALEAFDKGHLGNKHRQCAGLIVNPMKTEKRDPHHIYIAITEDIHDSALIHELAHVLDFLGGSGFLPGMTFQLSLAAAGLHNDHLDHPREFGDWMDYLKNRFHVELDAEDKIISYLNEHNMLIPSALIKKRDINGLIEQSEKIIDFLTSHRDEINELIKDRVGYTGAASPQ